MAPPDDNGKFSTAIGQDVIDAALKSVERIQKGEATPDAASAKEIEELKAQLELSMASGREMMGKVKDAHEKMLRAAADLENYKKRALKEKDEVQKYGIERVLKDVIPVIDNIDRALEHARGPQDYESLRKGLDMIRRLFEDTLGKHGVKSFTAKGKPFDPNVHEAMTQAETDEMPPNHVAADVLRGFTLNERLVRPALVIVSRAKAVVAEPAPAPAAEPSTTNTEAAGPEPKS